MAKLQPRVRTCAVVVFRANELQKPPQLWETATPAVLKMGMKTTTTTTTTTFPLSKTCSTTRSGRELQAPGAQSPSEPTARNRRITPIACYRVARAGILGRLKNAGGVEPRPLLQPLLHLFNERCCNYEAATPLEDRRTRLGVAPSFPTEARLRLPDSVHSVSDRHLSRPRSYPCHHRLCVWVAANPRSKSAQSWRHYLAAAPPPALQLACTVGRTPCIPVASAGSLLAPDG